MTDNSHVVVPIETELSNDTPNIVKYLPTYNKNKVDTTIRELKRELTEQKGINAILKSEKHEEKGKQIHDFIQRNEGEITDQISRLTVVIGELKDIIKENAELSDNEEKYDELINSDHSIRVANKIATLKELKKDAADFLEDAGITVPSIN
jgi:hypothetical protein